MKHKFLSKILTVVLAVITVCMSLPVTAFAVSTNTTIATATAIDGTTIKLTLGDSLKYDNNINWTTHQMYADGRMAYCVNPRLSSPQGSFGNSNLTAIPESNTKFAMLYKALHYGYDGQGFSTKVTAFGGTMKNLMDKAKSNHWLGASGNSLYYLLTHRVIAKIYGDTNWDYALTSDWITSVNEIYAALQKAPKLEVKYNMYLLDPKNVQQKVIIMQDKPGSLEIIKDSSNHTLTDNSNCYSLKGAVFTVTNTATKKSYTVTANTKVNDGSVTTKYKAILNNIVAGTYTVKEKTAPQGYALSSETKTVTVKAGATASVTIKDTPQNDPVAIMVKKESYSGKPLAGAEFTIKFYKGYFTKEQIENGSADSAFKRYWTLKTDNDGYADLTPQYLVDSNNDFYYTSGENPNPCLPLGTITIQETKATDGYAKDDTLYVRQITATGQTESVFTYNAPTIPNEPNTYYELTKTSEDGIVANRQFKIYDGSKVESGKLLKTVKTGADGKINEKLDVGTYTFEERTLSRYNAVEPQTITITPENTKRNPATVTFHNTLKDGTLKIVKTASDGNISGISFEVYDSSNNLVTTGKTNSQGEITRTIKPGSYRVHELVPDGYSPVKDQTVTVNANETRTVSFRNVQDGYPITVIKDTDNYDAGPFICKIEGISNATVLNVEVETYEPTVINLDQGKYKITEILTDEQKQLWVGSEPQEFIVGAEPITVTLENHEKTGSVKVIKSASDNIVAGLQFSLYGTSDAGFEVKYRYAATDESGAALFENVPVGTYTLEELSSHAIYNVTSSVDMDAVPVNWNEITEIQVKNDEKKTPFEIIKTSDSEVVEGFEFEITGTTTSDESVKLTNLVTDDRGRITGNLSPGKYTAKEVNVPNKYITPTEQSFTIEQTTNNSSAPVQLFFENKIKRGSLEVTKTAYDGNIENISFSLSSKTNANEVYYATTDNTGVALFDNIPIGDYVLREDNAGAQYVSVGDIDVTISYNETTKQNVANNPKDGYLKLVKTSDSGSVESFEFEITGTTWDGKNIDITAKTDSEGIILEKLAAGNYKAEEINVPNYFIKPEIQEFEITPYDIQNQPVTIDIHNELKRGYLWVSKGADDKFVEGVEFNLYGKSLSGVLVNKTVKTNADGVARFDNILIGNYKLREVNQPDRYIPVSEQDVTIRWNTYACTHFDNKLNGTIHTTATDKSTGEHYTYAVDDTTIVDAVAYDNLGTNTEYKLTGVLMDKETGEKLLVDGKEVIAEKVFNTGDNGTDSVDMEFTFNAKDLEGKSLVVFEYLSIKDINGEYVEVTNHTDITDEGQTIEFKNPTVRTTAKDKVSGNNTADISKNTTIIDTVNYKDLIANKGYKLVGVLMDKSTGKPLMVNGKEITAEKTFTATTENGSVDIEFTFDSTALEGKSVVAFETLYFDDKEIAVHADINDKGQTITFNSKSTEPATIDSNGNGDNIDSNGTPAQTTSGKTVNTGMVVPIALFILVIISASTIINNRKKKNW